MVKVLDPIFTNQNEDPSPASVVSNAAHMTDTPGQDTTESAGQRSATEEQRDPVLSLLTLVPHTQIIHNTREQTTFCDTKTADCH